MPLARGFTLIEILVAIGILGIFLPILTLAIQQASTSSRIISGRSEVQFARRQMVAQLEGDLARAGNLFQGQATPDQLCHDTDCLSEVVAENVLWYGIKSLGVQPGSGTCQTTWYGHSPGTSELYWERTNCGEGPPGPLADLTPWQRGVLAFELSPVCQQRCGVRYGFFLTSQAQNLPPPPDRTTYRPGQDNPCAEAATSLNDLTCTPGRACSCQSGLILLGGNL
jgi:prepilin-type N-terminal cleavage/methylation domain-containing protein